MIITRKDKIKVFIIVLFFISAWIILAYFTKTGAFKIFADVINDPSLLVK